MDFHIHPEGDARGAAVKIPLADLKAVFFVKTLEGDKAHVERLDLAGASGQGRPVRVAFKDGEVIAGFTVGYAPDRPGFFVIPVDPTSNNVRIFVVRAAVAKVEFLSALEPRPASHAGR